MNSLEYTQDERDKMSNAAKNFYTAFKGFGTAEEIIIKELTTFKNKERQFIKKIYLTSYGKTLEEEVKSELSGNFRECVLALLHPSADYEAGFLYSAMKGLGTDERMLIQILCTKDAAEIISLSEAYTRIYRKDLDSAIKSEQGGDLGRILRSIASGGRASNFGFDPEEVKKEAQILFKTNEGSHDIDDTEIFRILCTKSFPELRSIFHVYKEISGQEFEQAIRSKFSGTVLIACITIYRSVINKPLYYAKLLHDTCSGLGTKDKDLIRILVIRSEVDLPQIKAVFNMLYKRSLYSVIKNDTSGDYRKLLLAIIGTN